MKHSVSTLALSGLSTLSLSEAGPGRFSGQLSFTDIYHTMPYHARARWVVAHRRRAGARQLQQLSSLSLKYCVANVPQKGGGDNNARKGVDSHLG